MPEHVAVRAVAGLSRARDVVVGELGQLAVKLTPRPVSVIVFGTLARGDAGVESDIDVVVVRAAAVEVYEAWRREIEGWRQKVGRLSGNAVEILEVGEGEIGRLLRSRRPMWRDVIPTLLSFTAHRWPNCGRRRCPCRHRARRCAARYGPEGR